MSMKSNKKNSFYIALLVGVVSLFAITYIVNGIRNVSDRMASVNKAKNSLESSEDMKISNEISSNYKLRKENVKEKKKIKIKEKKESFNKNIVEEKDRKKSVEEKLVFNEDKGLSWPVKGKIIKEFSMDKLVYYPTIGSFKVNPAIFISAKIGDSVKSAYKGSITDISENKEIGKYIEMEIGNEYRLIYGQLTDIKVQKGDKVEEGSIIGKVGKTTDYYSKEGNHIYFLVKQKDEAINPMLLLR